METKQIIQNTHTIVANRLKYVVDILDLESFETVLDIGSWHLGQSVEFLELLPDIQIHAFEPNPHNFKKCQETHSRLRGYFKQNLHVYNLALNDHEGDLKFYIVKDENPGASSKFRLMQGATKNYFGKDWVQEEITVKGTTLDKWTKENNIDKVDAIWIDVQGAELDVFEGGKETLKDVKCIFTEVGLKPYYEGQSLKNEIDYFLKNEMHFVEITESFEYNGSDCEGNTIYVREDLL